ncbi:hypothetical protein ABIB25_001242 [Nakamurella sp. UYEF19]
MSQAFAELTSSVSSTGRGGRIGRQTSIGRGGRIGIISRGGRIG